VVSTERPHWRRFDPRVKLAYEESVRELDMQNETLNELHSRTGIVIAAATVAVGVR
jgi:hypothetical protein